MKLKISEQDRERAEKVMYKLLRDQGLTDFTQNPDWVTRIAEASRVAASEPGSHVRITDTHAHLLVVAEIILYCMEDQIDIEKCREGSGNDIFFKNGSRIELVGSRER